MSLPVLLATSNAAKAERLRVLCDGLDITFASPADLSETPSIEEEGGTHMANAIRKAIVWSAAYRGVALASDGGLAIPALGPDWSSLVTRRGTGGDVSDEEHAGRLLRRMRDLEGERRSAHWIEAVSIARDGALIGAWEASGLHGRIAESFRPDPEATPGFWVSGLWAEAGSDRRLWELSGDDQRQQEDPWLELAAPVRDVLRRAAG